MPIKNEARTNGNFRGPKQRKIIILRTALLTQDLNIDLEPDANWTYEHIVTHYDILIRSP